MGGLFAKTIGRLLGWKEMKVLVMGLDAAGKTTILYKLKLNETIQTIPTIGFNVESFKIQKTTFTVWDVGRQAVIRKLWHHYFEGTGAIVFVVDSFDRERIKEAKEELHQLLQEADLKGVPLLVLANKQDLSGVMTQWEVAKELELDNIKQRRWYVQGSCARSGAGLVEGFEWLNSTMSG